jgi:hypothetical protein
MRLNPLNSLSDKTGTMATTLVQVPIDQRIKLSPQNLKAKNNWPTSPIEETKRCACRSPLARTPQRIVHGIDDGMVLSASPDACINIQSDGVE